MPSDCTRCALHRTTTNVCIPGDGAAGGIMFVGEAPGAEEERDGRPFVGQAGKRLDEALVEAGLRREDVYIANAVRCRPPLNRTPTPDEAAACLPYLLQDIERVQPRLIVALGNAALATLTSLKGVTAARGRDLTPKRGLMIDAPIRATFHPAATLYDRQNWPALVDDLRSFAAMLDGSAPTITDDPHERRIVMDTTHDETAGSIARQTLGLLRDAPLLTCDLEWTAGPGTGVQADMVWPWRRDVRGEVYSLALAGRGADGNVHTVGLRLPLDLKTAAALAYLVSSRPVIFHNAAADMLWARSLGLPVKLGGDTLILAHLLDENQSKKLEDLCGRYLVGTQAGIGWKAGTQRLHRQAPASPQEWAELLRYNCIDARNTLHLHDALVAEARAQGRAQAIGRLYTRLMLPALRILIEAAYQGVPVDADAIAAETRASRARMAEAVAELAAITSLPEPAAQRLATSPAKTLEFMQRGLGVPVDSSRKDDLAEYRHIPAVAAIGRVRKEQKFLGTYFEPWAALLKRQGDGRLHTIYRMAGTRTGRLSAELEMGGSIHVAPRNDKRVQFRRLIRALHGRLILSIDLSQIELRVAAWIAGEANMLAVYERDRGLPPGVIASDLHLRTAIDVNYPEAERTAAAILDRPPASRPEVVDVLLGYPELRKRFPDWHEHRQNAKGANFGYAYGMREDKFILYARSNYDLEYTYEQSAAIRGAYMRAYPRLPLWHEEALHNIATIGYTETPFGRRRTITDPNEYLSAINTPVQSTASDLTLLAMAQTEQALKAEGLDAAIIGTVHDSVIIDVAWRDADRARDIALYEFENIDTSAFGFTVPVPIKAEAKLGETW